MFVQALLLRLGDQTRALDNARTASTELARRRVEREKVDIFLDRLHRGAGRDPATARTASGAP